MKLELERASGDWIGVVFIVVAILAQALNAMRKGEPPKEPEPRPQRPPARPQPQAQTPPPRPPVLRPEEGIFVPPFNPVPERIPIPAPEPVASIPTAPPVPTAPDIDTAELHSLIERLRRSDAVREQVASDENDQRAESLTVGTAVSVQQASWGTLRLQSVLRNRNEARRAILLAEVLQKPVSLR